MTPQTETHSPKPEPEEGHQAKGGCLHQACSALRDAFALIAMGPQRSADAIEWFRVSAEMCKHCKSTETVNEAAARIVAEWAATLVVAVQNYVIQCPADHDATTAFFGARCALDMVMGMTPDDWPNV